MANSKNTGCGCLIILVVIGIFVYACQRGQKTLENYPKNHPSAPTNQKTPQPPAGASSAPDMPNKPTSSSSASSDAPDADNKPADSEEPSEADKKFQEAYQKRCKALYEKLAKIMADPNFGDYSYKEDPFTGLLKNADHLVRDCNKNADRLTPEIIRLAKDTRDLCYSLHANPSGGFGTMDEASEIQAATGSKKTVQTNTRTESDIHEAYEMAKEYVSVFLKAPATAKFNPHPNYLPFDPNGYIISSYVDSSNSFGVPLRLYFTITLTKTQPGWTVQNFIYTK